MTAQAGDIIRYDGREEVLYSNPLEDYFESQASRPPFIIPSTMCWRGYVATWAIEEDRLFLIDIDGEICERQPTEGASGRVWADWYTGELTVALGEVTHYVHAGYASRWERFEMIAVAAGIVTGRRLLTGEDWERERFGDL